jgi:class 3 adenylate cyclase
MTERWTPWLTFDVKPLSRSSARRRRWPTRRRSALRSSDRSEPGAVDAIGGAVELGDDLTPTGLVYRAGLHSGEIERRDSDIVGNAVNIAARVEAKASPGEVLVSRTVRDLVAGSRIGFTDRGVVHGLKGVDDDWQLLAITRIRN